ncbi:hypothetical protein DFH11DRAFT_1725352 [Phellopilus nigrolimitatus]|nr:hypothetical protein DFH11DRAFT_1725352 [Phellopilus nigrolimitatus]
MSKSMLSPTPTSKQIVLTSFHDPLGYPTRFHWAFYVANAGEPGGKKLHVTRKQHGGGVQYSFAAVDYVLEYAPAVTAALVVGNLQGAHTRETLSALLTRVPIFPAAGDDKAEQGFDSSAWVRAAFRAMREAGIIDCPNVYAMEEEAQRLSEKVYSHQKSTQLTLQQARNSA